MVEETALRHVPWWGLPVPHTGADWALPSRQLFQSTGCSQALPKAGSDQVCVQKTVMDLGV